MVVINKTRVHTQHRTHGLQYSTVCVKLDAGHYQVLNIGYNTTQAPSRHHLNPNTPPLQPPPATIPTPTHHHSNPHPPSLQPPHATTPTHSHHHSSSQKLVVWRKKRRRKSPFEDPRFYLWGPWVKKSDYLKKSYYHIAMTIWELVKCIT